MANGLLLNANRLYLVCRSYHQFTYLGFVKVKVETQIPIPVMSFEKCKTPLARPPLERPNLDAKMKL
jgi:hypothetical protein